MASAGGSLEAGDVSVRTSIVSAWARLPSADTPDTSPAAMKQQLTASFHDFAVSLEIVQALTLDRSVHELLTKKIRAAALRKDPLVYPLDDITETW